MVVARAPVAKAGPSALAGEADVRRKRMDGRAATTRRNEAAPMRNITDVVLVFV